MEKGGHRITVGENAFFSQLWREVAKPRSLIFLWKSQDCQASFDMHSNWRHTE